MQNLRKLAWLLAFTAITAVAYVLTLSLLTAPPPPSWPAPPNAQVVQLAHAAGLEVLPEEGVREHIHAHLSITFNGKAVTVPANIGIQTQAKQYSEIHTHDTSGILHVESSKPRAFYLRQALIEWKVPLSNRSLGKYAAGVGGVKIKAFVDGKPYLKDLRALELSNRQDITIAITTDGSTPGAEPAFSWPANY